MAVVDEYFEKVGTTEKAELERIRKIVKMTLPEPSETISYDIPALN